MTDDQNDRRRYRKALQQQGVLPGARQPRVRLYAGLRAARLELRKEWCKNPECDMCRVCAGLITDCPTPGGSRMWSEFIPDCLARRSAAAREKMRCWLLGITKEDLL